MTMARTYLDYNASAPLRPAARQAIAASLDVCGNPSSVHAEGRAARGLIETAREQIATLVNAKPSEVVFTSGATEANNWALAGGWEAICVAGIEHDSVLSAARECGAKVIDLPVSRAGVIELSGAAEQIARAAQTVGRTLVAVMTANNETGVVQPVAEIAALAAELGAHVHVDAVQAPGRVPVDFAALGVDTLALSAHKVGGPRGVGALIVRDGVALPALIRGGGQERRRRSGTENVAGIAGFGAAAAAITSDREVAQRMQRLRDSLEDGVRRISPAAVIVGSEAARIANTSCVALAGKPAETLVIKLDLEGVAVSAGSACSSGKVGESHVLAAMGLPQEISRAAIRVSLGPETRDDDITAFLAAWEKVAGGAALAA
jgi:cysteine desulfurase